MVLRRFFAAAAAREEKLTLDNGLGGFGGMVQQQQQHLQDDPRCRQSDEEYPQNELNHEEENNENDPSWSSSEEDEDENDDAMDEAPQHDPNWNEDDVSVMDNTVMFLQERGDDETVISTLSSDIHNTIQNDFLSEFQNSNPVPENGSQNEAGDNNNNSNSNNKDERNTENKGKWIRPSSWNKLASTWFGRNEGLEFLDEDDSETNHADDGTTTNGSCDKSTAAAASGSGLECTRQQQSLNDEPTEPRNVPAIELTTESQNHSILTEHDNRSPQHSSSVSLERFNNGAMDSEDDESDHIDESDHDNCLEEGNNLKHSDMVSREISDNDSFASDHENFSQDLSAPTTTYAGPFSQTVDDKIENLSNKANVLLFENAAPNEDRSHADTNDTSVVDGDDEASLSSREFEGSNQFSQDGSEHLESTNYSKAGRDDSLGGYDTTDIRCLDHSLEGNNDQSDQCSYVNEESCIDDDENDKSAAVETEDSENADPNLQGVSECQSITDESDDPIIENDRFSEMYGENSENSDQISCEASDMPDEGLEEADDPSSDQDEFPDATGESNSNEDDSTEIVRGNYENSMRSLHEARERSDQCSENANGISTVEKAGDNSDQYLNEAGEEPDQRLHENVDANIHEDEFSESESGKNKVSEEAVEQPIEFSDKEGDSSINEDITLANSCILREISDQILKDEKEDAVAECSDASNDPSETKCNVFSGDEQGPGSEHSIHVIHNAEGSICSIHEMTNNIVEGSDCDDPSHTTDEIKEREHSSSSSGRFSSTLDPLENHGQQSNQKSSNVSSLNPEITDGNDESSGPLDQSPQLEDECNESGHVSLRSHCDKIEDSVEILHEDNEMLHPCLHEDSSVRDDDNYLAPREDSDSIDRTLQNSRSCHSPENSSKMVSEEVGQCRHQMDAMLLEARPVSVGIRTLEVTSFPPTLLSEKVDSIEDEPEPLPVVQTQRFSEAKSIDEDFLAALKSDAPTVSAKEDLALGSDRDDSSSEKVDHMSEPTGENTSQHLEKLDSKGKAKTSERLSQPQVMIQQRDPAPQATVGTNANQTDLSKATLLASTLTPKDNQKDIASCDSFVENDIGQELNNGLSSKAQEVSSSPAESKHPGDVTEQVQDDKSGTVGANSDAASISHSAEDEEIQRALAMALAIQKNPNLRPDQIKGIVGLQSLDKTQPQKAAQKRGWGKFFRRTSDDILDRSEENVADSGDSSTREEKSQELKISAQSLSQSKHQTKTNSGNSISRQESSSADVSTHNGSQITQDVEDKVCFEVLAMQRASVQQKMADQSSSSSGGALPGRNFRNLAIARALIDRRTPEHDEDESEEDDDVVHSLLAGGRRPGADKILSPMVENSKYHASILNKSKTFEDSDATKTAPVAKQTEDIDEIEHNIVLPSNKNSDENVASGVKNTSNSKNRMNIPSPIENSSPSIPNQKLEKDLKKKASWGLFVTNARGEDDLENKKTNESNLKASSSSTDQCESMNKDSEHRINQEQVAEKFGATTSPTAKPKTKKKKKKKSTLGELFEQTARKVSRHGDEVSVGTMTFSRTKRNTREVILSDPIAGAFEIHDGGSLIRPWEQEINKITKMETQNSQPTKRLSSLLAKEDDDGSDVFKIETGDSAEEQSMESSTVIETISSVKLGTLSSVAETDEDVDENNDNATEASKKGVDKVMQDFDGRSVDDRDRESFHSSEVKELPGLQDIFERDENLAVIFDDMWDDATCDASIALAFERKKRKKNRERERKRLKREKEKEQKANAARRLRLFEKKKRQNEDAKPGRKSAKQAKFSDEFLAAIHKLFEDDSVHSLDSYSDSDQDPDEMGDDMSADGSLASLYLEADTKDNNRGSDSEGSKSEGSDNEDSMIQSKASKSKSKKSRQSDKAGKACSKDQKFLTNKNKQKRSKRAEVDASDVFVAEVEKLKRPKVLTIQALQQEMVERRGTSVNLLRKEYATFKKRRKSEDVQQMDFASLKRNARARAADDVFGEQNDDEEEKELEKTKEINKQKSDGLAAQLSRWAAAEGVTELDDLATIVSNANKPNASIFGVAKNSTSYLPNQDLNDIARGARKGLTTVGKAVGGMVQTASSAPAETSDPQAGRAARSESSDRSTSSYGQGGGRAISSTPSTPLPPVIEAPEDNEHTNMFVANFGDMPLTSIQEGESDNEDEFGLLKSRPVDEDSDQDDSKFSVGRSRRSFSRSGGNRSKRTVMKTPSIGINVKKLVPKIHMPTFSKREGGAGRGRNGFSLSDDYSEVGLLG
jgi:hypothetical protein